MEQQGERRRRHMSPPGLGGGVVGHGGGGYKCWGGRGSAYGSGRGRDDIGMGRHWMEVQARASRVRL